MKIDQRDPAELVLDPLLKKQPGLWAKTDPRYQAMSDDVLARGIDQPLIVVRGTNRIAEGRHRWCIALDHQFKTVPVKYCEPHEVATIIVQSLLQRRHYNASQRAYLLAPTLDDAFEAARERMLAGVKAPLASSSKGVKTVEEWAATIAVSSKYLREARRIHEFFASDKKWQFSVEDEATGKTKKEKGLKTFREYYEPQILADDKPMGLGAVIAGIGFMIEADKKGKPHKGGKPDDTEDQLRLFNQVVTDEINRWDYWQNFDDSTKAEHIKTVRAKAATLPADQLEAMADYHAKLAAEFRKAAKDAKETK